MALTALNPSKYRLTGPPGLLNGHRTEGISFNDFDKLP